MIVINGVTGSIGRTLAQELVVEGYTVVGVGRSSDRLQALRDLAPSLNILSYSNTNPELQIAEIGQKITEASLEHEPLDGYVHCVGAFKRYTTPLEISYEDWRDSIHTNLTLNFFWNKWALAKMIPRELGSIVNLVSQASKTGGFSPITPYVASKGGIVSMTKNLSNWAAQYNVRINCVSPGFIDNEMMNQGLDDESKKNLSLKVPMKRFSTNHEVTSAIKFLLNSDSAYMNGTVLDVSGGLTNI